MADTIPVHLAAKLAYHTMLAGMDVGLDEELIERVRRLAALEPRLALLGQSEWWVVREGWVQYQQNWYATEERTQPGEFDFVKPTTYTARKFNYSAARCIEALDVDQKIRVAEMTEGHRRAVIGMLTRMIPSLYLAEYMLITRAHFDPYIDDGIDHAIIESERHHEAGFDDKDLQLQWFNHRPLIVALSAGLDKPTKARRRARTTKTAERPAK